MKPNLANLTCAAADGDLVALEQRLWARYLERRSSGQNVAPGRPNPADSWRILRGSVTAELADLEFLSNQSPPWLRELSAHVNIGLDQQQESRTHIGNTSIDAVVIEDVGRAKDILQQCDPDTAALVFGMITKVLVVRSADFIAATLPTALGLILINPRGWGVIDYVDAFVHEASHAELYIRQVCVRFTEGEVMLPSPLRDRPRPQLAVLHAAFVLSRVKSTLRKIIDRANSAELISAAQERLFQISTELDSAIRSLETHAHLTGYGTALLNSIKGEHA